MINFTHLKGRCPVCNGARRDCRQNSFNKLVHCRHTDANPIGWQFLKLDTWGFGIWAEKSQIDHHSEQQREEWRRQQEVEKKARLEAEKRQRSQLLTEAERNKEIRRILGQLSLNKAHKRDLVKRGLTPEQIQAGMFRSVEQWQKLTESVNPGLAGVNIYGRGLTNFETGYLCPVWNPKGQIIGWQQRLEQANDAGKYRWAVSRSKKRPFGATSHLPNGELPLTCVKPTGELKRQSIGLAEGILKPWIAAHKLSQTFIGAAGGNFASSPETFKTYLEELGAKPGETPLELYADGGAIANPQVLKQYQKTVELAEELGFEISIAWWNQYTKAEPDCDELSEEIEIKYITPSKFWEMAQKHRALLAWRKAKNFTPTKTINKQFFTTDIPPENTLLLIGSGMGTGKTAWIAEVVKALKHEGWVAIGYRNSLLIQSCERWDFYHLQSMDYQERILIKDPRSKIALCPDSLPHFQPEDFDGKNLIIDELMGVINHIQQGATAIKQYRDKCIELFIEALKRAKRIIAADGHLADWAVDYLRKLTGRDDLEVITIKNEYKGQGFNIEFVIGALKEGELRTRDRSPIIHAICNAADPIAIAIDSQVEAEALDQILTAEGRKVIRLDSKKSTEEWASEFLKNPDKYIHAHQPDVLIYTPCAESGLDISIRNYFTDQYVLLFGVLLVDPILQMICRIRDPECYRHIICPEYAIKNEEITRSAFPEVVQRLIAEYTISGGITALEGVENQDALIALAKELILRSQDENYKAFSIIKAKENYERDHLRECLKECLINAGHTLEEVTLESSSLEFLAHTKKEIKERNSVDRFTSRDIPIEEARKLDRKFNVSWEDRCAIFKAKLKHRLPGIDQNETLWNAELFYKISYDDPQFISKQELFWLLQNPEVAKLQQQEKWLDWLGKDTISLQEVRSRHLKVKALKAIGIEKFLEPGFTWTADSPEVQAAVKAARDNSVKLALGAIGKQSPVEWIGRQLQKIGLETKSVQSTENNLRKRIYSIEPKSLTDCYRWEVLQAIDRRWQCYLNGQKTTPDFSVFLQPKTVTQSSVEGCTPSPENIYIYPQRCAEDNQPDQVLDPVVKLAVEVDNPSLAKDDSEEPAKAVASESAVTALATTGRVATEETATNSVEPSWRGLEVRFKKSWQDDIPGFVRRHLDSIRDSLPVPQHTLKIAEEPFWNDCVSLFYAYVSLPQGGMKAVPVDALEAV